MELRIKPAAGGKFELLADYVTPWGTVPKGFLTDGASVPRVFWPLFSPVGKYFSAAVAHDYFYATQIYSRLEADNIFAELMKRDGVNYLTRATIYRAVRLGGWLAWSKQKKK